jgi:hypothetical protein
MDWIRVKVPLLEDEPLSPLGRACAAADFGNGISGLLPGTHTYINPDLTVYLHRYPEGEWVALEGESAAEDFGVGLAACRLHDERGRIGRSLQSLRVDHLADPGESGGL